MRRKLLPVILAFIIIFGMLPAGAYAEESAAPIVVVPGIMGSKLYKNSNLTDMVWGADRAVVFGNLGNLHIISDLHTKGLVLEGRKREYGTRDAYKNLVDFLCREYAGKRDVYFFSYDWRRSTAEAADKLHEALDKAGIEKADFICHSAGGHIMSHYVMNDEYRESVNKVITLGTPYEGADKLLVAVFTNHILGDYFPDSVLESRGLTKYVKLSLPGVGELAPFAEYWDNAPGNAVLAEAVADSENSVYRMIYDESSGAYIRIMKDIYGEDGYEEISYAQAEVGRGMERLISMDNAYFIMGDTKKTVTGIVLEDRENGPVIVDLGYGPGDGTVPLLSANMLGRAEGRAAYFDLDHGGIMGNTYDRDWENLKRHIKNILDGKANRYKPRNAHKGEYIVIRIQSTADAKVELNGKVLNSDTYNYSGFAGFGRMDVVGAHDDIKMFCLDSGNDYRIVINGKEKDKMDYTVRFFDEDGALLDERTFVQVPLTADTVISAAASRDEDTVLNVDENKDGEIDRTWTGGENAVVFKPDPKPLTVRYVYNDGVTPDRIIKAASGSRTGKPAEPEREGWEFLGWYESKKAAEPFDFGTIIENDMVLTARWKKLYSVDLKTGAGGTASVWPKKAGAGEKIRVSANPGKDYEIESVTYTPKGGSTVGIMKNMSFTMLETDVTVRVTFRRIARGITPR